MSLESALDEERREVMRLLEGRPLVPKAIARTSAAGRSASPVSAQSPVRSMLDIGVGITNPQRPARAAPVQAIRSMLDTSTPAPPPAATVNISPLSPNQAVTPATTQSTAGQRLDPETAYQFEMLPTVEAYALPKRVTQGGKLPRSQPLLDPGGSGSGSMPRARSSKSKSYKSTSPSSRLPSGRPISPGGRRLNTNSLNLMSDPGVFVTDSGKSVDMQTAYRRLSDAALLRSGGSLSVLANRRTVDAKGEAPAPGGGTRLHEDYYSPSEGPALDSSDDSDDSFTGKSRSADRRRGRRLTRNRDDNKRDDSDSQSSPDGRRPKSLLAAAEEERKKISSNYRVRSLLSPGLIVAGDDDKITAQTGKRAEDVHPTTSFDQGGSNVSTPGNSDAEADMSDIKNAQRLAMVVSAIQSAPEAKRVIRQVLRGQFVTLQREAERGLRRQRVYLVAVDLSDESAYALEWTIGTVLRDGDTLIAVYAIDEEAAKASGPAADSPARYSESAEAASIARDTASLMSTIKNENENEDESAAAAAAAGQAGTGTGANTQPDLSSMGKSERERYHAANEVTDRCIILLRKTRLQVRVVVEVFHCKSPRHMITEVIDFLEPTLVILGSRGRNALKGVLLGSFSNYLVTKSSVPVMVARKRLRKHSKYQRTNLRMSNVLQTPSRGLAGAKVD